ncbi:MAG: hypothetical protein ACOCRK_04880 [bacterium]
MINKIIGICCLLFGIIGLLVEITNYTKQRPIDYFGLILACLFIITGILLYQWKYITRFTKNNFSWQTFLTVTGIIELIIGLAVILFIIILGLQGFISGEMGTMVGIFSLASLLFLLPYIVLKAVMIYGFVKKKKCSVYISLFFGGIYLTGGIVVIFIFPIIAILLLIYAGLNLWAGIKCLKNTSK